MGCLLQVFWRELTALQSLRPTVVAPVSWRPACCSSSRGEVARLRTVPPKQVLAVPRGRSYSGGTERTAAAENRRTINTWGPVNILRSGQNGRQFPDDIFKCIFLKENVWISIKISLKFVPKGPINNIPALVQIMAWHRPGDKPLSEKMMVSLGLNELKFCRYYFKMIFEAEMFQFLF